MDGRQTYVCMYGRTFETGFIRSTLSKGSFGSEFPAICNHCVVMVA